MRLLPALVTASILAGLGAMAWPRRTQDEDVVRQPIEFNHAVHAKENIACDDCHSKADEKPYATFPSLKQCLLCHKEAEQADEPATGDAAADPAAAARRAELARQLREYSERGEGIPWVTVNRLVGHVYFSHVAHVRFAEMKCEECHGDMSTATRPPQRSQIESLTMERCMQCHTDRGASNDCLVCHK